MEANAVEDEVGADHCTYENKEGCRDDAAGIAARSKKEPNVAGLLVLAKKRIHFIKNPEITKKMSTPTNPPRGQLVRWFRITAATAKARSP